MFYTEPQGKYFNCTNSITQIDILNEDFNALNSDYTCTSSLSGVKANVGISFVWKQSTAKQQLNI
jgi:hypothetical protein